MNIDVSTLFSMVVKDVFLMRTHLLGSNGNEDKQIDLSVCIYVTENTNRSIFL